MDQRARAMIPSDPLRAAAAGRRQSSSPGPRFRRIMGRRDRSGGSALPLAGRQNKLRALVSSVPPGRQHDQAALAGELCPQQHLGPWPLASEWERISVPRLLRERHTRVQETMATKDLRQGHRRGFPCSPMQKTEASRCVRISAGPQKPPEAVGAGTRDHILHFCFAKCAPRGLSHLISVLACSGSYVKNTTHWGLRQKQLLIPQFWRQGCS